ncbi:SMP-30/gluconolactonase/LRE family protein [Azospirillum sp. sgz302134]
MSDARPVVAHRCTLGEGPLWSVQRQRLYWTDIQGRRLWCFDPLTGTSNSWEAPDRIGCMALRRDGTLLAAFARGFAVYDPDSGRTEPVHDFEPDIPSTRLNDGRCDRQGRFIAGGTDEGQPQRPISSVWRLDADHRAERLIPNVAVANSLCFSPDGRTLYMTDTPERVIRAYDYDPATGRLGERRDFHRLPPGPGNPDGSTVDSQGFLWNAEYGGGRVVRYAPDGTVDRVVTVPTPNTTCPAFGGPNLTTLYVTTAAQGREDDPLAGQLFAIETDVPGLPEPFFAG